MGRFKQGNVFRNAAAFAAASGTIASTSVKQVNFVSPVAGGVVLDLPAATAGNFIEVLNTAVTTATTKKRVEVDFGGTSITKINVGKALAFIADGTTWRIEHGTGVGAGAQNLFYKVKLDSGTDATATATTASDIFGFSGGTGFTVTGTAGTDTLSIVDTRDKYAIKRDVTGTVNWANMTKLGIVSASKVVTTGTKVKTWTKVLAFGTATSNVTSGNTAYAAGKYFGANFLNVPSEKHTVKFYLYNSHNTISDAAKSAKIKIKPNIVFGNSGTGASTTTSSSTATISIAGSYTIPANSSYSFTKTVKWNPWGANAISRVFDKKVNLKRNIKGFTASNFDGSDGTGIYPLLYKLQFKRTFGTKYLQRDEIVKTG